MHVLVDVDDTLASTQDSILNYCNRELPVALTLEDITHDYREHGEDPRYQDLVQRFLKDAAMVGSVPAFPWAQESLQMLSEGGYNVIIASARKENLHATTEEWLAANDLDRYVADIAGRRSDETGVEFKQRAARSFNAEAVFDDTLSVVSGLAEIVSGLYLIDRPWNRVELDPEIERVATVKHGVETLLAQRRS